MLAAVAETGSSGLPARLLLLASSCLVVAGVLLWLDDLFERHYYSGTYRYYETAEVYWEDENTLLLFSPDRELFWVEGSKKR